MTRYACEPNDFRRWIRGFGKLLNVPVTGGKISLPPELGTGYARTGRLAAGISCIVIDFSLRDDLVLLYGKSSPPGLCLFFDQEKGNHTFQLASTGYDVETAYPRDSPIKRAGIFFPSSFLRLYLRKEILSDLLRYLDNGKPNKEPIPFEYRQLMEELFQADSSSSLPHLVLHNRLLLLTEKFLHSFVTKAAAPPPAAGSWSKGKGKDVEALKNIMTILSDSRLNKFPSIEILSRTAMMSSTKLKMRFKEVYGMKLYEFYNRHRMEQAKEMLKTGSYSVKQVGIDIGFSNLSNFAKAFRKEFGILPKEILKNKQPDS